MIIRVLLEKKLYHSSWHCILMKKNKIRYSIGAVLTGVGMCLFVPIWCDLGDFAV